MVVAMGRLRRFGLTGLSLTLLINVWTLGGVPAQAQNIGFYTRVREQSLEANEALHGFPIARALSATSRPIMALESQATAESDNRRMLAKKIVAKKSNRAYVVSGLPQSNKQVSSITSKYVQGTELTLFSKPSFGLGTGGFYSIIKAPFPNQCFNLVAPFNASLQSLKINWNKDDKKPNHVVCGQAVFWNEPDCYGRGWYYEIPGGWADANPKLFTYGEYKIPGISSPNSNIMSVECGYHPKKTTCPPPCTNVKCPANARCVAQGCHSACYCGAGYLAKKGACVAPSSKPSPPPKSPPPPKMKSPPPLRKSPPPPKKKSPPPPRKSPPPPQQASPPPSSGGANQSNCLDGHNAAREAVGLGPLVWSDAAAAEAQKWSNVLAGGNNCLNLYHGGADEYGQNLYGSSGDSTCADAVQAWVDERELYTYALFDPPGASGSSTGDWGDIGHYTQIVWKTTTAVGCAKARCTNGGSVWTCDYSPPGNYIGQYPY